MPCSTKDCMLMLLFVVEAVKDKAKQSDALPRDYSRLIPLGPRPSC
jgi:hypothetical protein